MRAMQRIIIIVAALVLPTLGEPVNASEIDHCFESSAKESYVFRAYLRNDDIKIQSMDGVVILSGTVNEKTHKSLAQETVSCFPGVKSVDNRLEIKFTPFSVISDAWISFKVKTMFLFYRNVSTMTEINTKYGILTLEGRANSQAQKDLTTNYAKDVCGVVEVHNEMTVARPLTQAASAGVRIDDASITAMVKMTLLDHHSTSALSASVTTNEGVVTLSGKAGNSYQVKLVTNLVKIVKGVQVVNNQMTTR